MAEDTDIRGVQTPDAIPLPDAAVLDGSASIAEFTGLLRDSVLAGGAAAAAAQTAAEAAAGVQPPPDTTYTVERRVRMLSPAYSSAGVAAAFTLGSATSAQLVERVVLFFNTTSPVPSVGPRWQALLALGPQGSVSAAGGLPAEWIQLEAGFCDVDSAQGGAIIFDSAAGYYVPAGYELKVFCFPDNVKCSAQWVELG